MFQPDKNVSGNIQKLQLKPLQFCGLFDLLSLIPFSVPRVYKHGLKKRNTNFSLVPPRSPDDIRLNIQDDFRLSSRQARRNSDAKTWILFACHPGRRVSGWKKSSVEKKQVTMESTARFCYLSKRCYFQWCFFSLPSQHYCKGRISQP